MWEELRTQENANSRTDGQTTWYFAFSPFSTILSNLSKTNTIIQVTFHFSSANAFNRLNSLPTDTILGGCPKSKPAQTTNLVWLK